MFPLVIYSINEEKRKKCERDATEYLFRCQSICELANSYNLTEKINKEKCYEKCQKNYKRKLN